MHDRILAVLHGREHDRVPFAQYSGVAARDEEIWSVIGWENMGLLRWSGVHRIEHPNCSFETHGIEINGRRGTLTIMHTPEGELREERLYESTFGTSHITEHFVKDPGDYRILMSYLRDIIVLEDIDHFLRDQHELGGDGLTHVSTGRTPYQQLWVQWVSLEDLCLHLVDYPDILEECISLMARNIRKVFEIVRNVPVPYVVIPDNITAPTIGEKYFERYCVPLYNELAEMLDDRDVPVFVHMDGDLKPLWRAIGESKVRGIDSLSPPPDNDTSAGQAASMWPEMKLFLNFPSSVHLRSAKEIYEVTEQILQEAGHSGRLEIQISENVPPGIWRKSFPEIVRAIRDFGAPKL